MDEAAVNTKIESIVESLENLANAIFDGRQTGRHADRDTVNMIQQNVVDARNDLRLSLKEFLQPRLRVMTRSPVQPYAGGTNEADKIKCPQCGKTTPCAVICSGWALGLRNAAGGGGSVA